MFSKRKTIESQSADLVNKNFVGVVDALKKEVEKLIAKYQPMQWDLKEKRKMLAKQKEAIHQAITNLKKEKRNCIAKQHSAFHAKTHQSNLAYAGMLATPYVAINHDAMELHKFDAAIKSQEDMRRKLVKEFNEAIFATLPNIKFLKKIHKLLSDCATDVTILEEIINLNTLLTGRDVITLQLLSNPRQYRRTPGENTNKLRVACGKITREWHELLAKEVLDLSRKIQKQMRAVLLKEESSMVVKYNSL